MRAFAQYTVDGLTVGCFYALVALGYTIIYGIIRLINFAHGDLAMVGSFVGWTLLVPLGLQRLPLAAMALLLMVVPVAVGGVLSVGMFDLAYKPLLRRPIWATLIAALGLSLMLRNGAQVLFGASFQAYPTVLTTAGVSAAGVHVSYVQIFLLLLSVGLMAVLYYFAYHTVTGTAMRALAVDHDAARLMGINVHRLIRVAFLLGGTLAAAAGVMLGIYYTEISFNLGFLLGLRAFTAAVVGGIGNIPGAMVGGLLIGLTASYSVGYVSGTWQDVIIFGVLIGTLVLRPSGLLGERVAQRV